MSMPLVYVTFRGGDQRLYHLAEKRDYAPDEYDMTLCGRPFWREAEIVQLTQPRGDPWRICRWCAGMSPMPRS